MASNGRIAGVLAAATLAAVGIAHEARGLFAGGTEDVGRVGFREPPRPLPHFHPPAPAVPEWIKESRRQITEWEEWPTAVCLAYSFATEVGPDGSDAEFSVWVVRQFNRSPPARWQEARDNVDGLFNLGQEGKLVDLTCQGLDLFRET